MKHIPAFFLTLTLAAAACGTACAASSGLTLKGGAELQDSASTFHSNNVALGAEYVLVHQTKVSPFTVSVYGDILGDSSGFGLSARTATPVYIGAGAGFYHASFTPGGGGGPAVIPPFGGPPAPAPPYTANGAGGKLFAGFEIAKVGLEAGYHFMPTANGYVTNALSLELALHF